MIMNNKLTREQISSHQPQMRGNTPISTTTSKETLSKNKCHHYHPNGKKSFALLTYNKNYLNNNIADSQQTTRPMKFNKSCQALQHLVKEKLSISRYNKTHNNLNNTYYLEDECISHFVCPYPQNKCLQLLIRGQGERNNFVRKRNNSLV